MEFNVRKHWSRVPIVTLLAGIVFAGGAQQQKTPSVTPPFTLPAMPYSQNALEPYISTLTISIHFGKHHQTYVDNLNKLASKENMTGMPLEDIIRKTTGAADKVGLFNNAAQVWNHTFFWKSMKPRGGGVATGKLAEMINTSFGSFESFTTMFSDTAAAQFGSGWVWLIQDGTTLRITKTSNADTPIAHGQTPLLTCDVWEHAYYLDYQNQRKDFVKAFLGNLVNWEFAATQLK